MEFDVGEFALLGINVTGGLAELIVDQMLRGVAFLTALPVPMTLLCALALGASAAGIGATWREWDERARQRTFAEIAAWRALRLRRESPFAPVEERARLAALRMKPLAESDRARFLAAWRRTRLHFAAEPARAVAEADDLVAELAYARGVPAWTLEHDQATPLAWRHPELEQHYRTARRIALVNHRGMASRTELDQALHSYKVICRRLLESAASGAGNEPHRALLGR